MYEEKNNLHPTRYPLQNGDPGEGMKILVAASGSHDGSTDPVAAAASFPWPEGSEIHVLTIAEVIQPSVLGVVPPILDMPDVQLVAPFEMQVMRSQPRVLCG